MRSKRIVAALLALGLLCGAACAEPADNVLRVIDFWGTADAYRAQYPDRAVEEIEKTYDQDLGRFNTPELVTGGDWDVACLSTRECDLAALYKTGLLMDLSGEKAAAGLTDGLYPAVRSAVTADNRLIALPVSLYGIVMQFSFLYAADEQAKADLYAKLGLTAADAPRTFADLCSLGRRYMALPAATRKGTVFDYDCATGNMLSYFLGYLIDLYAAETCDAQGRVEYDTPAFRTALGDLESMIEALQTDPKVRYGENGSLSTVVYDASSSLINGDALFLRIGEGKNTPAQMDVIVVNAATPHKAEALDYLAVAAGRVSTNMTPLLYAQLDYDALLRQSYEENIAAQIEQGEDQSVIDTLTRLRDAGDERYYYSRAQIAGYAENVAPNLTFPRVPSLTSYPIAEEYAKGRMDADALVAALDAEAVKTAR